MRVAQLGFPSGDLRQLHVASPVLPIPSFLSTSPLHSTITCHWDRASIVNIAPPRQTDLTKTLP
jgi:hypothetical protein